MLLKVPLIFMHVPLSGLEPSRPLANCRKLPDAPITAFTLVTWETDMFPDQFAGRGWPKTVWMVRWCP